MTARISRKASRSAATSRSCIPQPPLMGTAALEKALIEMWNRRMEFHVFRPVTDTFRNSSDFFKGRIPQVPEYVEVARRAAEKSFVWLDEVLGNQRFIAGDKFTIADITALCAVDFARVSKIRIQPEQKNLARWREEVSSAPAPRPKARAARSARCREIRFCGRSGRPTESAPCTKDGFLLQSSPADEG